MRIGILKFPPSKITFRQIPHNPQLFSIKMDIRTFMSNPSQPKLDSSDNNVSCEEDEEEEDIDIEVFETK